MQLHSVILDALLFQPICYLAALSILDNTSDFYFHHNKIVFPTRVLSRIFNNAKLTVRHLGYKIYLDLI